MDILFGPVPSRRYGQSLGIDLVPMKTCCYDCLFCQLGPTPKTTLERRDYVPLSNVFEALTTWLSKGYPVDMFTLCGSGEPTLHAHFGEVLTWIAHNTDKPSLLMSNGALFDDPMVRSDAMLASRTKISLHFWDEESFQQTVRPHPGLHFEAIYKGWQTFREAYQGMLDVEFFAMPGFNTAPAQLDKIYALLEALRPDTITVNTAERPPAEACVKALPPDELKALRCRFATLAAERTTPHPSTALAYSEAELLALARRHPLTPEQFATYFGQPVDVIRDALQRHAATDPFAARALAYRQV
jgi:wyosine [tRNA(Phe)-imidazoG37] synthetase (radical SAM superfamily)